MGQMQLIRPPGLLFAPGFGAWEKDLSTRLHNRAEEQDKTIDTIDSTMWLDGQEGDLLHR